MQFAQIGPQHRFTSMEWFETELTCTYDARYTYANGVTSGCEYADMQADFYQNYINNQVNGLPSYTAKVSGTAVVKGTATIQ